MNNQPSTVAGLLVGTVIGVALFGGSSRSTDCCGDPFVIDR